MTKNPRIYVAGHRGMVGSAIVRNLLASGDENIVTCTRSELDLTDQHAVRNFFASEKIEQVYLAAAKVGGIHANNIYPAEFLYNNLMIEANIVDSAWRAGVEKLLFLGSSCIYPRLAPQPMGEESLLTGKLEPTNEPYAIAKIAGIKLCESYNRQYGTDYRSVMPTNLYGPGDNYHPDNSHVIPALIHKFHMAKLNSFKSVEIWGTGQARREFLYVDDMASASISVMDATKAHYSKLVAPMDSHINVGTGVDVSINELARTIASVVGFNGEIKFDISRPDGAPRKLLRTDRLKEFWDYVPIPLKEGLELTYKSYLHERESVRGSSADVAEYTPG